VIPGKWGKSADISGDLENLAKIPDPVCDWPGCGEKATVLLLMDAYSDGVQLVGGRQTWRCDGHCADPKDSPPSP